MMNNKKWVVHVIVMVLLVSMLAGCAGNSSNPNSSNDKEGTKNNGGQQGAATEAKPKLTFWNLDENPTEAVGLDYLKEKFAIDIAFIPASREAMKETLNLQISSGDIPDWWKEPTFPEFDKFLEQDVAAAIPQELIEKHMPKYLEWLKRYLGEDPFKFVRRDGNIYALPVIWDLGADGLQLAIREDWLRQVGIEKTPETLEEMEAALTKFRHNDPDQNNKQDTYGLTATGSSLKGLFSFVFGAFDVYPGMFQEKDGKIVRGEVEPAAKEALEVLNRWYKNELIDPEFVVNKGENVEEKVLSDKVGAVEFYWWAFLPDNSYVGGEHWYGKLKKVHPDFEFAISPGMKGPSGAYGIAQSHPAVASGVMFGKHLEEDMDKLELYLQVFEATQFDAATYEHLNFGVEGTHWQRNENGTVEFIGEFVEESARKKAGISEWSMAGSFNDYDFQTGYTAYEHLRERAKEVREQGTSNFDILATYNKPYYNEVQDKLNQFALSTYIDFITGRKPLSEFDHFVNEWNKQGGEKMMEEAQQIYELNH